MNAEASVANLVAIVERLAESNELIVNGIFSGQVESETVRETDTLRETETIRETVPDGSTTELTHHLTPAATAQAIYFGFDFDDELESSRAYQRATRNDDNFSISVISSADRTASWSILSGISLSQVSSIAAVRLPVFKHEIENSEDYVFEQPERAEPTFDSAPYAPSNSPLPWRPPQAPTRLETSTHQRFVRTTCSISTSHETSLTKLLYLKNNTFIMKTAFVLEFNEGEVLLVHEKAEAGWMEATSLRSRMRGWVQMEKCIYEPEVLKSLMTAIVSL